MIFLFPIIVQATNCTVVMSGVNKAVKSLDVAMIGKVSDKGLNAVLVIC